MKKLAFSIGFLLVSLSSVSASSCIDFQSDFAKGEETRDVLTLQNFLAQKGLLTVNPNGYFGPSTFLALKRYQSGIGATSSGEVNSSTRLALKNETCTNQIASSNTPSVNQSFNPSQASGTPILECIDFQNNITKGKENGDVLKLQNFLIRRGILMVAPNGYFGPSTLLAVKEYQKSVGLANSGVVFPLTRQAIKNETCTNKSQPFVVSSTSSASTVTSPFTIGGSSFPSGCSSFTGFSITTGIRCMKSTEVNKEVSNVTISSTSTLPITPKLPLTLNDRRQNDINTLLGAMYAFYLDSHGTFPIPYISTSSIEICTLGISLCDGFNEVKSSLVPKFLSKIPMDPSLASSTGSGYFITRQSDGTITLTAPKADAKTTIFATCNFNSKCQITSAVDALLAQAALSPHIDSIDKATFISGSSMSDSLVIRGSGFSSSSNIVNLSMQGVRKTYTLGTFPSIDGVTINASSSFTNTPLACGSTCSEIPPIGGYDVTITTKMGESNAGYLVIKSITTGSTPNSPDKPFIPKSTHVKLATITISSSVLVDLKSLTLHASSSPVFTIATTTVALPILASKISNFTLTDVLLDKIINSGPSFTFTNQSLMNNQSKIYELYADIADIDNIQAGQVTFTGDFTVKDYIGNSTITVPIPKFLITISY